METKDRAMKVSIIIPTYNVEQYILECLESVANQTYSGDMECIIVDDCGTDKSIAVADEFISSYQGAIDFKIIHRENNGGLSAARNSGTRVATGDYIYYLDSDDYIKPYCIGNLVSIAMKNPKAEVIQAGIIQSDSRITFNAENAVFPDVDTDYQSIISNMLYQRKLPVSAWNKLIRRDFLLKNNISFTEGVIFEDVDFEFRMAKHISCWALCRSNTYIYRVNREGSILYNNKFVNEKTHDARMKIFSRCVEDINDRNIDVFTRAIFGYFQIFLIDTPTGSKEYLDVKGLYNALIKKSKCDMKFLLILYQLFPNILLSKRKFRNCYNWFFSHFMKWS